MAHNGNGSDPDDGGDKLIRFPTLAERDQMRKARAEQEWREDYKSRRPSSAPFFNFSKIPPFTRYMVLAFVAVHAGLHLFLDPRALYTVIFTLGFVPGNFTGATGEFPALAVLSPFTYLFIHGSWVHLAFNSLMMFAMGTFFEREFGARKTAFMFFGCGLAGAALCLLFSPFSGAPVVGASGAITGLFGAVTMLLYQRRPFGALSKHGAAPLIIFWVVFMVVMGLISGDKLAWQAHVGGFLGGIGLLRLMQGKFK